VSFSVNLQSEDPMVQQPERFIMAGRMSVLLRGIGNAFGVKIRMSKLWEQQALEFLNDQAASCTKSVDFVYSANKCTSTKTCPVSGSVVLDEERKLQCPFKSFHN
jgi:hypothetical protein